MSFDNDYPNRKDWCTPYRKPKSFDPACRNHGSCGACTQNKLYHRWRTEQESLAELHAFKRGYYTTPLYACVDRYEELYFKHYFYYDPWEPQAFYY